MAEWLETGSKCPSFTLTKQTSHTLVTTLRFIYNLVDDLLIENYDYILMSRFQSDPIKRHFSKYRQMSGGCFLVSLREVRNPEKILLLNSIIKADLNFWEESICVKKTIDSVTLELHTRLDEIASEISECQLNEESKEGAASIAGYVTKGFSSRSDCNQCKEKLIINNKDNGHDHYKYLKLLSPGGVIVPSLALTDFIFQTFSISHYISHTIHGLTKNGNRKITENVLQKYLNKVVNFARFESEDWGIKFSERACINIFYSSEQKRTNQSVRKDQTKDFKKRQRMTKAHL